MHDTNVSQLPDTKLIFFSYVVYFNLKIRNKNKHIIFMFVIDLIEEQQQKNVTVALLLQSYLYENSAPKFSSSIMGIFNW